MCEVTSNWTKTRDRAYHNVQCARDFINRRTRRGYTVERISAVSAIDRGYVTGSDVAAWLDRCANRRV